MADPNDSMRDHADKLLAAVAPPTSEAKPLPEKAKIYRVGAPGVDVGAVANGLARWYEQRKLKVQLLEQGGVYTIQCRSASWRRAVGMAVALTVVLHRDNTGLIVEIGSAPWVERAGVAAIGTQVPVLLPTVALGAWEQARLPEQTLQYIRSSVPVQPGDVNPAQPAGTGELGRRLVDTWRRGAAQLMESMRTAQGGPAESDTAQRDPVPVSPAGPASRASTSPTGSARLDVNTATAEELAALPGLGAAEVAAILEARRSRGGAFASRPDFERTSGLKPHVIVRLRDVITVVESANPPATRSAPSSGHGRVIDL
jgi:hypothetical protein